MSDEQSDRSPMLDYASPSLDRPAKPCVKQARPTALDLVVVVLLIGVLVGLLMPSMTSRRPANSVRCMSNLRQLGVALNIYARENRSSYPDSLEQLVSVLSPKALSGVLICPGTADTRAAGATTQQWQYDLTSPGLREHYASSTTRPVLHLSYVYVGSGLKMTPGTTSRKVLAYEPLSNHGGRFVHVLFADGHVEQFKAVEASKLISELDYGHNLPRVEKVK